MQISQKASNVLAYLSLLSILLIGYWVYRPALAHDFVDWDDYTYVIQNDMIRRDKVETSIFFKRPISLNYHPLTMLSMRANRNQCASCFEGISARPFILWNIILHLFNVVLVFILTRRLFGSEGLGAWLWPSIAAAVFAWQPLRVESVVWVSERKDVLYVAFFLLSLLAYDRFLRAGRSWLWYGAALVLFVAACLSKAMAVALVPVLMLWSWYFDGRADNTRKGWLLWLRANLVSWLPFLALALFFGLMAVKVQGGGNFLGLLDLTYNSPPALNEFGVFSLWQRLAFAGHGFFSYLVSFFYPVDLCTFYPYPTQVEYDASWWFKLNPLLWFLLTAVVLWSLRWTKDYVLAYGFYFFTVALVLQFISVGAVIKADRYTYLPYLGLTWALIAALRGLSSRWTWLPYLALVLPLAYIPLTKAQIATWQDSDALWSQVIRLYPQTEQAYSIRGNYYGKRASKASSPEEQASFLNKAFADFNQAVQLQSQRPEVYEGLGNIHGMRGQLSEALGFYNQALKLDPKKGSIYFNRAVTHSLLKDYDRALADYEQALLYYPERSTEIAHNRALLLMQQGKFAEAKTLLLQVVKAEPRHLTAYTNLGLSAKALGQTAEARQFFQQALQINPQDNLARTELGGLAN